MLWGKDCFYRMSIESDRRKTSSASEGFPGSCQTSQIMIIQGMGLLRELLTAQSSEC